MATPITIAAAAKSRTYVREIAHPDVGIALRRDRQGSESDLVRCFVADLSWEIPEGSHLTVFHEPKLESGFPDIVLVIWDTSKTALWPDQRLAVTPADIRIVHHLVTSGSSEIGHLLSVFGHWVSDSLERLAAAQMIYRKTGQWHARKLDKIFAARQIVAFEAKMAGHSDALLQASRNRWFASHSYIIVPKKPRDSWPIRKANQFGIGLWSLHSDNWVCQVPSAVETIPRSYASWLFNEWVWRLARLDPDAITGDRL
jgi:hypothetical protein